MRAAIRRINCSCARALAALQRRVLGRRLAACASIVLALLCAPVLAQGDGDFMAAREAFRTGNRAKLDALAADLQGHVLYPYVEYWRMRQRLGEASPTAVRDLIARLADGPMSDRLRNDWLKSLGELGSWEDFQTDRVGIRNETVEVACYELQRRMAAGEAQALRDARARWLAPRPVGEPCTGVFEAAMQAGVIGTADIWGRIRLALQYGQVTFAKKLAQYVSGKNVLDAKALAAAAANPRVYLERRASAPDSRGEREIAIFALNRLARSGAQEAASRWQLLASSFPAEDREYVWSRLGYYGALQHDAQALAWFARAGRLSDDLLEWRARAALRASQWGELIAAVDSMSESARAEPEWRYWKARALKVQGKTVEANALLAPLSTDYDFYGLLAGEELGEAIGAPSESYRPGEDEIRAIAATPALQRALALYRLGLRYEGNREWIWAIGGFDDRQLLASAELARRNELWDRAINTAERTRSLHDFGLRYLAPYRDRFSAYAAEHGLDEAWVFGVVRQESRFVADARSSAGAMGLMQLMPATAKWVAGKLQLKGFRQATVTDLDTNISLGTYYLKHVLDTLDNQPVLASAGYNAGPGRARAWRPDEEMEGAIYAETIPFSETRDYVKKVMTNASFYARAFGKGLVSLKERLGVIPPRGGGR